MSSRAASVTMNLPSMEWWRWLCIHWNDLTYDIRCHLLILRCFLSHHLSRPTRHSQLPFLTWYSQGRSSPPHMRPLCPPFRSFRHRPCHTPPALPDSPFPACARGADILPRGARPAHGGLTVPFHTRTGVRRPGCELASPCHGPERAVMRANAVWGIAAAWFDGFLWLDRLMATPCDG